MLIPGLVVGSINLTPFSLLTIIFFTMLMVLSYLFSLVYSIYTYIYSIKILKNSPKMEKNAFFSLFVNFIGEEPIQASFTGQKCDLHMKIH